MTEQWRPVRGYEGKYIVSNKGNVMSVTDEAVEITLRRLEALHENDR